MAKLVACDLKSQARSLARSLAHTRQSGDRGGQVSTQAASSVEEAHWKANHPVVKARAPVDTQADAPRARLG